MKRKNAPLKAVEVVVIGGIFAAFILPLLAYLAEL
jgi:hypothetical protein